MQSCFNAPLGSKLCNIADVTDCVTATWPLSVPIITSGWSSASGWLLLHHICTCPFILWCNTSSWWHRKPFDYHIASVRAARAGPATCGGDVRSRRWLFVFIMLMFWHAYVMPLNGFPLSSEAPILFYVVFMIFTKMKWHHNLLYCSFFCEDCSRFNLGSTQPEISWIHKRLLSGQYTRLQEYILIYIVSLQITNMLPSNFMKYV